MNQKQRAGLCQETSGFLFRHPCDDIATQQCEICSRQICAGHSTFDGGVTCCVACRKERLAGRQPDRDRKPEDSSESTVKTVPMDNRDFGGTSTPGTPHRSRSFDSYDPYFYGYWHYPGYYSYQNRSHSDAGDGSRHDADDFTEADSESLIHPGDEMYEQDMSES